MPEARPQRDPTGQSASPKPWERARRALRAFGRDHVGAVAMTVGLAIIPLTLAAGLAIDAGRWMLARSRLAQATDAAALAAGSANDADAVQATVERMLHTNFDDGYMGITLDSIETQFDEASGRISVTANATVPTVFMRLAHIDSVPLQTHTVVVRRINPMEVVLVLDVTGSMSGSKIAALKEAASDLVNILFGDQSQSDDLRIAVVPFSVRVNIGDHRDWLTVDQQARNPWQGCVQARSGAQALNDDPPSAGPFEPFEILEDGPFPPGNSPFGWSWPDFVALFMDLCPPPLLPLKGDKQQILDAIDGLTAQGSTRIDMGARWGWRVLSRRWEGLWGEDPRKPADEVIPAMVIMTDGMHQTWSYIDEVDEAGADANLLQLCQSIKDEGTVLYTITFQAPAGASDLMEQCATSSAHYFESPTSEDLSNAFHTIAGELSALRLAE